MCTQTTHLYLCKCTQTFLPIPCTGHREALVYHLVQPSNSLKLLTGVTSAPAPGSTSTPTLGSTVTSNKNSNKISILPAHSTIPASQKPSALSTGRTTNLPLPTPVFTPSTPLCASLLGITPLLIKVDEECTVHREMRVDVWVAEEKEKEKARGFSGSSQSVLNQGQELGGFGFGFDFGVEGGEHRNLDLGMEMGEIVLGDADKELRL